MSGENRQITGRVNAKQTETARASSKTVSQELSNATKNNAAFGGKHGSSSGYLPITSASAALPRNSKSNVKGPIRCHKCQMLCVDAGTYLAHTCIPRASSY